MIQTRMQGPVKALSEGRIRAGHTVGKPCAWPTRSTPRTQLLTSRLAGRGAPSRFHTNPTFPVIRSASRVRRGQPSSPSPLR